MADYDIAEAFENIEDELISSMMRNFSKHRVEENDNNFCWSQWQAEQLKSLEQYRKSNSKKFNKQFTEINGKVEEMLRIARANGNADQEAEILQAIKDGFKVPQKPSASSTAEFFKVNSRKLNALIKATTDDLKKAETAVLRMSNDKYRKAIYNAQVYANSGAGTYEKAVDMACRDMLRAGLNCIEYSNGARHTLSDYADMALKTANKRAYLYGEGKKRKEFGISTVVVNSRQGGCSQCAQYIGKVFIDDVYSGGTKSDGDYPLLSNAIAGGLFHPRCKDSTSTYYEGITTLKPITADEMAEMERREQLETKQQYAERQAKRFDRRGKYSLDDDNKRIAKARADEWYDRSDKLRNALNIFESESNKPKYLNPNTVVDKQVLNSPSYRQTLNELGESQKVTRSIFQQIKAILSHRTGGEYEDLSFIDSITGKAITRTDYDVAKKCIPSKAMKSMVLNSKPNTIIAVHNHPGSSVPSLSDINTAWKKKYKYGIIACHNGDVYKYNVLGKYNEIVVDSLLDTVNKLVYNRDTLKDYDKLLSHTLEQLRENNIVLEVFLWA